MQGSIKRLFIHKSDHEQFARISILNHSWCQALHLVEVDIDIHRAFLGCNPLVETSVPAILLPYFILIQAETKNPLGVYCASGLGFPMSAWLSVIPRRHADGMVMMVVSMGSRSHIQQR
jgi:hypothetical protein